jgi:hypothetical protein
MKKLRSLIARRSVGHFLARSNAAAGVQRGEEPQMGKSRASILTETPSANYEQRTEWNVRDTGGTAVFSIDPELTGGTKMTVEFTVKHKKPCRKLHPAIKDCGLKLRDFVSHNEIQTLNVAGRGQAANRKLGSL